MFFVYVIGPKERKYILGGIGLCLGEFGEQLN